MKTLALVILFSVQGWGQVGKPVQSPFGGEYLYRDGRTTVTLYFRGYISPDSLNIAWKDTVLNFDCAAFQRDLDSTLAQGRKQFIREFLSEWDDYMALVKMRNVESPFDIKGGTVIYDGRGKKLGIWPHRPTRKPDFEEFMERFTRHLRRELK